MSRELERQIAALQQGDHLCLIYETAAEQMAAVVPFVREGLVRGERCVYIVDDRRAEEVAAALAAAGVDIPVEAERRALLLLTKRETYLRSGEFDPERMIAFLRRATREALSDGFSGLRATGEMTWALGPEVGCDRLIEYEALLNNFFPGSRAVAICQYNRLRFSPMIIREVLRTHPLAILGDQVCPNLYYESPAMVLGQVPEANQVEWMIAQLRQARATEQALETDISRRKQMEEEIHRLNEDLERRVLERTAQLEAANLELESEIAERKGVEEKLRKLSRAVEQSPACVVITDTSGNIEYVNPKFTELTGYTLEETIGKNPRILKSGETPPEEYGRLWRAITSGGEWRGEFHNKKKNGELYWESASISPIRDAEGAIAHFLAVKEDITERKRNEQEIKKLNEDLLRHAQELNAVNKELEAFSYSVSHDLRAPLRGIDGFSLALLEDYADKLDPQGRDYLHRVRSASQRMAQLIDDVLALSRVTRAELSREEVDLSALAESIATELRKAEPGRKVEFVIGRGILAMGDARLLRTVLENLLGNAWKFTSNHSTARIEFGVTRHEGVPAYFVRDDGAGFDQTYVDKLFRAFQRLHSHAEFPGSGIGLATVQRIINRHGGRVWAHGEPEKGATLYFTLQ